MVKLEKDNQRLRDRNSELQGLNRKLLRRGAGYDEFIEDLRDILEAESHYKGKLIYTPPSKIKVVNPFDKDHKETATLALSDLHLTENVKWEDSNGINVYNSIIASNRLYVLAQKVKSILGRHMAMYTLEEMVIFLLGDIINGTIHPEMLRTNDLTNEAAVILAARLLKMFLQEIGTLNLKTRVLAKHGNHPRTSLKMPTKSQATTNYDWVVYEMLRDIIDSDPTLRDQFSMTVETGQISHAKIYDWNYVYEHGIDVKSGAEESFEDRVRALFDDPVYRQATGYKGPAFDQIVIGNMHKPKFLERTIVNGSITGQNELGQSWRLKPIRAQQLMWGVCESQVRTFQYQLDLTDMKSDKVLNPFSEYTKWFVNKYRSN